MYMFERAMLYVCLSGLWDGPSDSQLHRCMDEHDEDEVQILRDAHEALDALNQIGGGKVYIKLLITH